MARTNPALQLFGLAAQYGRTLLVVGLLAGIFLPELASAMRPWLQELVALLMFLAALRIGPKNAFGALADAPKIIGITAINQLVLPLVLIALFWSIGMLETNLATALILMAAASSISGSPNLTIMVGADPAPALRLLVIGTALLPLTVLPVFYCLPVLGSPTMVMIAAAKLLGVIALSALLAFGLRRLFLSDPGPEATRAIDGCSAIAMAVIVVGLMSSVGSTLATDPAEFVSWLAIAFLVNFGLQLAAYYVLGSTVQANERTAFAIIAGNRNIALFLVALPAEIIDPVLLFIGCYQIPMYLTPIVMKRFYARN